MAYHSPTGEVFRLFLKVPPRPRSQQIPGGDAKFPISPHFYRNDSWRLTAPGLVADPVLFSACRAPVSQTRRPWQPSWMRRRRVTRIWPPRLPGAVRPTGLSARPLRRSKGSIAGMRLCFWPSSRRVSVERLRRPAPGNLAAGLGCSARAISGREFPGLAAPDRPQLDHRPEPQEACVAADRSRDPRRRPRRRCRLATAGAGANRRTRAVPEAAPERARRPGSCPACRRDLPRHLRPAWPSPRASAQAVPPGQGPAQDLRGERPGMNLIAFEIPDDPALCQAGWKSTWSAPTSPRSWPSWRPCMDSMVEDQGFPWTRSCMVIVTPCWRGAWRPFLPTGCEPCCRPRLLLDLQELVLAAGGPHWLDRAARAIEHAQAVKRGWGRLKASLRDQPVVAGGLPPSRPATATPGAPRRLLLRWAATLATAAAVLVGGLCR